MPNENSEFGIRKAETPDTPRFLDQQKLSAAPHPNLLPRGGEWTGRADDFRSVKATVPAIEFGAVQWAAKRCLRVGANGKAGPIPLDEFLREALREKLRAVVKEQIAKGKPVPPDIAHVVASSRLKVEG